MIVQSYCIALLHQTESDFIRELDCRN